MAGVVEILDLGKQEVMAAIAQPVKDFEDMFQYQCAKAAGCDYIVTNDRRHYDFSDIPYFSSANFVEQLDELIKQLHSHSSPHASVSNVSST
jgi:hypothetical protein